jgi:hypothetical protein
MPGENGGPQAGGGIAEIALFAESPGPPRQPPEEVAEVIVRLRTGEDIDNEDETGVGTGETPNLSMSRVQSKSAAGTEEERVSERDRVMNTP